MDSRSEPVYKHTNAAFSSNTGVTDLGTLCHVILEQIDKKQDKHTKEITKLLDQRLDGVTEFAYKSARTEIKMYLGWIFQGIIDIAAIAFFLYFMSHQINQIDPVIPTRKEVIEEINADLDCEI